MKQECPSDHILPRFWWLPTYTGQDIQSNWGRTNSAMGDFNERRETPSVSQMSGLHIFSSCRHTVPRSASCFRRHLHERACKDHRWKWGCHLKGSWDNKRAMRSREGGREKMTITMTLKNIRHIGRAQALSTARSEILTVLGCHKRQRMAYLFRNAWQALCRPFHNEILFIRFINKIYFSDLSFKSSLFLCIFEKCRHQSHVFYN